MPNSSNVLSLLHPIAFQPAYVDLCNGSITAGLMLSQVGYWDKVAKGEWFYKTRDEWYSETRLTRSQQESARQILRENGFLSEDIRQNGNGTKIYFKLDREKLTEAVVQWQETCQSSGGKPAGGSAGNLPGVGGKPATDIRNRDYTEITTETTFTLSPPSSESVNVKTPKPITPKPENPATRRRDKFVSVLSEAWEEINPDTKYVWEKGDYVQLAGFLKRFPELKSRDFREWFYNYANSEGIIESATPKQFLPRIHMYKEGPLNKYNRPLEPEKKSFFA